jgi:DNA-binding GntR family transcriptional regulator
MGVGALSELSQVSQLKDRTYDAIRSAICDGVLGPGEALVETELARQLGVSKTPVREALLKLEADRLVERIPNTGSYVRPLRLEDIESIYPVKRELEALAVRLATERMKPSDAAEARLLLDQETRLWELGDVTCSKLAQFPSFHGWLWTMSGNHWLIELMRILDTQALRLRLLLSRVPGWVDVSAGDHRRVLEAMVAGDSGLGARSIKQHNDRILEQLRELAADGLLDA